MIEKLPPDVLRRHKGLSFVGVATCFFCHDGSGNLFMAHRSQNARDEHGRWDVGAGGLKWGVTAEENIAREVEEEYGVKPLEISFLGYRDAFREMPDGVATHWIGLDFLVKVDRESVRISEPDMFDESGWFTVDNLPEPLHSQIPYAIEKYKATFEELKPL